MTRVRERGENIRRYIIDNVEKHPKDIAKVAAENFSISRQAVNKHLQKLTEEGALEESGNTRRKAYKLRPLATWYGTFNLNEDLHEDVVWREHVRPQLVPLPENVISIWNYGFTEMFNNAIDHSDGQSIFVSLEKTASESRMRITDDGVGIFRKIQTALNLMDERHAVLELHKGKLTTDPRRHSGEGIFFTSRMFDRFDILSGGVFFSHDFADPEDWILGDGIPFEGTSVMMSIHNHTARTIKKIFDQYSTGDDYGFNKTVVPVSLARYGNDQPISRSQAKRLLARVELFSVVILDFKNVESIGQAFADEIFRVFANEHPGIELQPVNANSQIKRMIARARARDAK